MRIHRAAPRLDRQKCNNSRCTKALIVLVVLFLSFQFILMRSLSQDRKQGELRQQTAPSRSSFTITSEQRRRHQPVSNVSKPHTANSALHNNIKTAERNSLHEARRRQQRDSRHQVVVEGNMTKNQSFHNASSSSSNTSIPNTTHHGYFYDAPPSLHVFPQWIQDYVTWHADMRRQFPGMELFTNPQAPKVLVRTCLGMCGGLHDRLGQLPWDLYLANNTGRVLLLAWQRPRAIEHFLVPSMENLFNWSIPSEAKFGFVDMKGVRTHTELFVDYPEANPNAQFWDTEVDLALERATTGSFKDVKILRHRLLGHLDEAVLEERLRTRHGESLPNSKLHSPPLFGNLFWLFFQPSKAIRNELTKLQQTSLSMLQPQQYSAVHCRVRHPKAHEKGGGHIKGKNPVHPADKTGLPWVGETRQFALEVATKALSCSQTVAPYHPIYFLSDSNDLVRHVTVELRDAQFVQEANTNTSSENIYPELQAVVQSGVIVARDVTNETAHLDRQKGRLADAYYSTFVDLFIAIHAHCVVYGIGYYAVFAAKISGTQCKYLYQKEAWGSQGDKEALECPN
jgi:hypothetical protein